MKEISSRTEKNVLNGLVLDEKGHWVSIAEKVERERSFLMHLEAGEILSEGRWISISELSKKAASPVATDPLLCVGAYTDLDETRDLSKFGAIKNTPKLISEDKSSEKKIQPNPFIAFPIIEAEEETKCLERINMTKEHVTPQSNKNSISEEYLEETMSFDMKAILNDSKDPLKKSIKTDEINDVADSWDMERKRSQVLFFSITATVAILAIIGAIILAFVL
jgi:hypothetical protein